MQEENKNDAVFASRVNYFNGQLLDEADFKAEQEYHREMVLRHNREVHGKGIARGLDVQWYQGQNYVTVSPGSAVDGLGRHVALLDMAIVPLPATVAAGEYHLMLSYREDETAKREYEGEDALRYVSGFTRTAERAVLEFLAPGSDENAIVLAGLRFADGVVQALDPDAREYMELTAGELKVGSLNFLGPDETETGVRVKAAAEGELRVDANQLRLNGGLRVGYRGEAVGTEPPAGDAVFGSSRPVTISGRGALGFNAYRRGDDWKVFAPGTPMAGLEIAEPADLVFRTGAAGIADGAGSPAPVQERLRVNNQGLTINGDLNVSGKIREGNDVVTGASWTPLNPRAELGLIPLNDGESGASREYALPGEIPADACEIRIYAFTAIRNNDLEQSIETVIYTQDGERMFTHYMYARCYDPHAGRVEKLVGVPTTWISSSDNFWLPITPSRTVKVAVSWLPADGNKAGGDGLLYVTGYR